MDFGLHSIEFFVEFVVCMSCFACDLNCFSLGILQSSFEVFHFFSISLAVHLLFVRALINLFVCKPGELWKWSLILPPLIMLDSSRT
jgi:hypothetical protein